MKTTPLHFSYYCILLLGSIITFSLSSCTDATNPELEKLRNENQELNKMRMQDSLYISDLTGEMEHVYAKLDSMRSIEDKIRSLSSDVRDGNLSANSAGSEIQVSMEAIEKKMQESYARIKELESKYANANGENKKLLVMIEELKKVVQDREKTIEDLQQQVSYLKVEVQTWQTKFSSKKTEADSLKTDLVQTTKELKSAYYAVGTEKDLSKSGVIISKKKGLEPIRNAKFYIKLDIDEDKVITIGQDVKLKKVTLVPVRAENSYRLYEMSGSVYLEIKDPAVFWKDKYLAIITK